MKPVFKIVPFAAFLLFAGCKKDKAGVDISEGQTNWTKYPYWDYAIYNENADPEFHGMYMYDVEFVDDNTGYLVGNRYSHEPSRTIYKTTDGGQTWAVVQQGGCGAGSFNMCVLAPSPDQLFVGSRCHIDVGIQHSTDGVSWSWNFVSPMYDPFPALENMDFHTNAQKFFMGKLRTTNGGSTWQFMDLPGDTKAYSFAHAGNGLCVTSAGSVYRTTDSGDSWTFVQDFSGTLDAITEPDDATILIGGTGIRRSTDDGATWTQVSTVAGVTDLRFVDENTGFAAAGDRILKTTDGGLSWTVNYQSQIMFFRKLEVVNSTTVVAIGNQQKQTGVHKAYILKTTTLGE